MCDCHDPIVFGHANPDCPVTAVPGWGYTLVLGCTPDCRAQHAVPDALIEAERAARHLAAAGQR